MPTLCNLNIDLCKLRKRVGEIDILMASPECTNHTCAKGATFGGGGYWINPGAGNKNHWFVGWVLERKITDKLTLGVELFHQTPDF
jgi:hypothetical protein